MTQGSQGNNTLPLMLNKIHSKLTLEISQGQLNLPNSPKEIPLHRQPKESRGSLDQSRHAPNFKSQFSPEDKRRLKQLKERFVVFEKSLQEKSKEALQLQRLQGQRARAQQSRRLKEEWQRHRQGVLIRKQQRWLQKKEQSLLKNEHKTGKASSKRILYQQLQKERHLQEQLEEKSRAELLSVLSQHRRNLVNIAKLADHEKTYLQKAKEEKLDRMRRMEEIREATRRVEQGEIKASFKSKFYERVLTEVEEQRREVQEAQRQKQKSQEKLKEFLEKIRSESALVAQKHRKQRKTNPKQQEKKHNLELHQIGNRFLKESLKQIARNTSKRSVSTEPQQPLPLRRNNYLQELKQNRMKSQGEDILLFHEGRVEKILASSETKEEKVEKLKRLAYRLEAGRPSSDAELELQKIKAKMRILDATLRARQ